MFCSKFFVLALFFSVDLFSTEMVGSGQKFKEIHTSLRDEMDKVIKNPKLIWDKDKLEKLTDSFNSASTKIGNTDKVYSSTYKDKDSVFLIQSLIILMKEFSNSDKHFINYINILTEDMKYIHTDELNDIYKSFSKSIKNIYNSFDNLVQYIISLDDRLFIYNTLYNNDDSIAADMETIKFVKAKTKTSLNKNLTIKNIAELYFNKRKKGLNLCRQFVHMIPQLTLDKNQIKNIILKSMNISQSLETAMNDFIEQIICRLG